MGNYISRDEFAKYLADIQYGEAPTGENIDYQNGVYAGFDMAYVALERFPAADVRPVVLCRDCKHYNPNSMEWKCDYVGGLVEPYEDDFCSYGEADMREVSEDG